MTFENSFSRSHQLRRSTTMGDLLAADIAAHLGLSEMRWLACNDRPYLKIPGHRPFACTPPAPRRRLAGRDRNPAFYEETTTLLISYLVGRFRPSVFFDIGAAKGYFARVAASHIARAPQVHAFEMQPNHYAGLVERLRSDAFGDRITSHHAALTDRHHGETPLWFSRSRLFEQQPEQRDYRKAWWRRAGMALKGKRAHELSETTALVTCIDHVARRTGAPGIVKIDVEGYEAKVIQGGLETFMHHRPFVVLELHRGKRLRFGTSRRDVAQLLFDAGYRALLLTDHHEKARCEVVELHPDSPLLERQETDLLLFFHDASGLAPI